MSKKEQATNGQQKVAQIGGPGIGANQTSVNKCLADCGKKPQVAGFCEEHFRWFKEGMITKEGKKPVDFDKKLLNFMKKKKAA
ncbi:MAG: hypothetical protein AB7F59_04850 [Bdellovibrionales bacterium]